MLALLVFIYLGLASSAGTVPLQALPGFYGFVASFEPLRQIVGAIRAILYFNAAGDAGLDRGLVLTAIGLVLWVAVGTAVTRWYDRKGLDRIQPELIEHLQASVRYYQDRAATAGADPSGAPAQADRGGADSATRSPTPSLIDFSRDLPGQPARAPPPAAVT
jgi:hypothetical protein